MKPFPPLVFFGSDHFSAAVLQELLKDNLFSSSLKYVVTKTPRISGRGRKIVPTEIDLLAQSLQNVEIIHADTRAQLDAAMAEHHIASLRPMGVLVSYGVLISADTLSKFTPGIVNLHPSALPRYRGPSPVESAMLAGDTSIGISVMLLTEDMDAGPVYAATAIEITPSSSRDDVYTKIVQEGSPVLLDTLHRITSQDLQPEAQNHSQASFTKLIRKEDGQLLPAEKTADELTRQVRTFLGFPKSRIDVRGHTVIVTKAHVVNDPSDSPLIIECAEATYLSIDELIGPSGKTMSAEAFLRGYQA